MSGETFILLLSSIVNLLLAGIVYFKNPKSKTNIFFAGSILMLVLWTISVIFARLTNEHIIWVKNAYFFSISALILFLGFLKYFPSPTLPFCEVIFYFLFILGIIGLFSVYFTPFFIKAKITYLSGEDPSQVFGPGVDFLLFYLIIYLIFLIYTFLTKYSQANRIQRAQLKLTFLGIFIFLFLASLSNLGLPRIFKINLGNIGPAFSFVMVGFIGYAIGRYKLFELKLILTEILVVLIGTILLIQITLAETLFWQIVGAIVLSVFSLLGYSLIKSVYREIEYREKLQRAYEELKKLDKAKSEFLSIASHQLRTPLSIIKGYLSMIIEGTYGKTSQKIKKIVEVIYQTNEQLIKLVNHLLNISRIEAGKIEMNFKKIYLQNLIKEIIKEIKPKIQEKKLSLKYYKEENLPKIRVDPEKIKEVLLNILDNAIKYTPKGQIKIVLKKNNASLLIKISDTGVGMTKEELKSVFESFKRGRAGEKFWTSGSGLGLYVAKKFIQMHQGKIWAESKGKNQGSTFYIELPIS